MIKKDIEFILNIVKYNGKCIEFVYSCVDCPIYKQCSFIKVDYKILQDLFKKRKELAKNFLINKCEPFEIMELLL